MDDNGIKICESVTILRYLTREKLIPDHWYPRNIQKRGQIDEFLEWQKANIHLGSDMYFKSKFLEPLRNGTQPDMDQVNEYEKILRASLDDMENFWLNNSNRFLFGNKVTIADLLAAAEIEQPRLVGYEPKDGRPRISEYIETVKKTMHPYYEDAHAFIGESSELPKKKNKRIIRN